MKDFLEFLVKQIVNHPEDVIIDEKIEGGQIYLTIHANTEDLGLIIGKGGKTIHSLRSLTKAKAIRENVRVFVEIDSQKDANI